LVAFVPLNQANEIGWVPLAPGDPYVARYYDDNWQPHYLTRADVVPQQVINLNVPGAVTVVPLQDFNNFIEPGRVMRVDPQLFAGVRPVLDPLTLTPLRNAAIHSAWSRGRVDLPPGIAKKLYETPVITSVAPLAPPFRRDLARALRVEEVPEKVKHEKWNLRDERQGNESRGSDQTAVQMDAARNQQERRQRIAELAAQASQGNDDARRQVRQLEREQRTQQVNEQRAQRAWQQTQREQQRQQAQGERIGRRAQQQVQREVQRQQMPQQIERRQRPAQSQSGHEERQQGRAPQQIERPQVMRQPRHERQQQMQQEQRHQQVQQQSAPAQKHEDRHGPRSQPGSQSEGGGGKGKGKERP
jgi:hypothetical protein